MMMINLMTSQTYRCRCCLIFLLFWMVSDSKASKLFIDTKSNHIVDEYGRVRIFHGFNRVQKGVPYYPVELLNDTHVDNMVKWGFNVVRLGTMWAGLEIAPFSYNLTYLNKLEQIVQKLENRNIYVIFDMHQDALSTLFGIEYNGVPTWLIKSFPPSKFPYPFPFKNNTGHWMRNYLTWACGEAFNDIYQNTSRALDHLGGFWHTVAKTFGSYSNVLGYELINEPFPGNLWKDPSIALPGKAGREILQPFYDTIVKFIHQVDSSNFVFYEPVTWGMIFNGKWSGSGFTHVPGGNDFKNRSVFSFHYYCWAVGPDDTAPFPLWKQELCDSVFFPQVLRAVKNDVSVLGGSAFLTEFGNCQAGEFKNSTEYKECLSVLTEADQTFTSWTYFDSKFYNSDGSEIEHNVKLFSRTYAMAIAGQPTKSQFDSETGQYTLSFLPALLNQPTIIYISPLHYPKGFNVITSSGFQFTKMDNKVLVKQIDWNVTGVPSYVTINPANIEY